MRLLGILSGIILALSISSSCFAEAGSFSGDILKACDAIPQLPAIPNGRKATEEEMLATQQTVKTYMAAGNSYIDCLNTLEESWGEAATDEQRAGIVLFNNKIVDDQIAVKDLFNQAIRAYKGKN